MKSVPKGAPRPRVLACGLSDVEIEQIRPLAGSLVEVSRPELLSDVHPEEHDVLVVTDADFHDHHLVAHRRVAFAGPADIYDSEVSGRVIHSSVFGSPTITCAQTQFKPARDFKVAEFARENGVESLVRRSCLPAPGYNYTGFRVPVYPPRETEVLAWEHLTNPLALGALLESETIGPVDYSDHKVANESVLWLPDIARSELKEWLRFAFIRWRDADPDTFPESAEWKAADDWASPEETVARRTLREFDQAEALRRAEAENARVALAEMAEAATQHGERWRAILTTTGDELVASVKELLEGLGLDVIDADSLPENKGKKREDLRVTYGDWIALVEVKGYVGAAKSNDLQQVTAAATAFAASACKVPSALWYVVNAFREQDPAQRLEALASREEDLAAFAENHNGCLFDTRDLFRLRQRVSTAQISAEDARTELMGASARYTSPPLE